MYGIQLLKLMSNRGSLTRIGRHFISYTKRKVFFQDETYTTQQLSSVFSRYYCENSMDAVSNWISGLDENAKKQIKIFEYEIKFLDSFGKKSPDMAKFEVADYERLLSKSTQKDRNKEYAQLWKKQNLTSTTAYKKKQIRQEENRAKKAASLLAAKENKHIQYGVGKNSLLMRIRASTIDKWRNHKLWRVFRLDGPKLIFDCGFNKMTQHETTKVASELTISFGLNRKHCSPFFVHFCNLNGNSGLMDMLKKRIPTMLSPTFPLIVHEQCFTNVFPKEKIVYLSPDSDNVLDKFNRKDVYVIGGFIEDGPKNALSLAKAKKLDLRHARLPLDKFVKLHFRHKTLSIEQMTRILLDWKNTNDWNSALKHVEGTKGKKQMKKLE